MKFQSERDPYYYDTPLFDVPLYHELIICRFDSSDTHAEVLRQISQRRQSLAGHYSSCRDLSLEIVIQLYIEASSGIVIELD